MQTRLTGLTNADGSPKTIDVQKYVRKRRMALMNAEYFGHPLFKSLVEVERSHLDRLENEYADREEVAGPELLSQLNYTWGIMTLNGQTRTTQAVLESGEPWRPWEPGDDH